MTFWGKTCDKTSNDIHFCIVHINIKININVYLSRLKIKTPGGHGDPPDLAMKISIVYLEPCNLYTDKILHFKNRVLIGLQVSKIIILKVFNTPLANNLKKSIHLQTVHMRTPGVRWRTLFLILFKPKRN